MDYDDNDLNSQNFHLAGEGSAKFPPGLQPYALPKFDFDDNLQSHLRFDSLVETEVFLGIESNQDNNWIEDFSRGSSGIEFNPSAAEPCSISRRDNVWSEATSSESVEMLLNSVGQEEVIGVPTIIEESDACDEPGCVTKQMDHSLEHEENILPGTADVKVLENTIPSDEEVVKTSENSTIPLDEDAKIIENTLPSSEDVLTVENTLLPNEDVLTLETAIKAHEDVKTLETALTAHEAVKTLETALTAHEDVKTLENALPSDEVAGNSPDKGDVGEGQSGIKDISQTQGIEVIVGGDSNPFDQSADGEKSALHLNEEVFANIGCGDEIERGIDDFSEKHVDVQSQGEPITPGLPSDILVVPIPDVATAGNEVVNMDAQHQTSDFFSEKPDDHVLRKEAGMDDQNVDGNVVDTTCVDEKLLVHSASEEVTVSKDSLEVSTGTVEEPCSGSLKGQSDFCTVGDESLETMTIKDSNCEDVMMHEGIPHDDDQLRPDKPYAPMCDAQFESSQIYTTLEPSADYFESSGKIDVLASAPQLDDKDDMQNPDVVVSSTEKSNTEIHVLVTNLAEPTLTSEKVGAGADAEYVSISEKQNAMMLNACSNMDIDSPVKEVRSSPRQDESRKELDTSTLQHVTVVDSESAAAVTSSDLVSQAMSDVVPVPSEDGVTIEVGQQSSQIPLPIVGSNELEEQEETFSITVAESAVSLDAVSSKVEAVPNSVSEAEKNIPCDTDRPSSSKVADQSLPPTNNYGTERLVNASASTVVEVSMECTTQVAEDDAAKAVVSSDTIAVAGNFVPKDDAIDSEPNTGKETIVLLSESPLPSQPRNEDKVILPTSVLPLPLVQPADSCLQDQEDNGGSTADQRTQVPDSSELSHIVSLDNGASSLVQNLPVPGSPMLSQSVEKSEKQDASASKVIGDKVKHKGSNSRAPKATVASKEVKTGSSLKLSKGAARRNLLPLPTDLAPRTAELSPSSSLPVQLELKIAQETPQSNTQVSEVDASRGRPKSTSERKPRRSSVRATVKESAKKGSQPKETTPVGQPEKLNNVSVNPPALFHVMQSNEMQPYGHLDANNSKPYFVLATSTSSLPDLNSSASPSTVFHQPFTDFQQVQLRAQIFVYGALIQGTAPEEAYMVSAFGGLDGGRNLWYNAWQASIERLQSIKSTLINPETPKNSRFSTSSVSRPVDQVSKQSATQNKVVTTPVGRSTNKSSQSVVSPMIPLSSPIWNMPTPMADLMQSGVLPRGSVMDYQQTLPHLHPSQTPPSRSLAGNNTSWMSQPSYRSPWQPSGLEASHFSAFPSTETAQLTPVKETSVSQSSVKHAPSGPTVQTGAPTSVFTAASPLVDLRKGTPSHVQQSAEPKTRKRKKNLAPEETTQTVFLSQPQFQPAIVPIVSSNLPTSAIKTPAPLVSQSTSVEKLVLPFPPPSLLDPLRKPEFDVTPRAILSENPLVNIKEASKHAEDATALASAAVGHSQEVWNQLEKQKNLGLVLDHEAKLACAAVAVAAAAAVARAASAVANVASNAALQAKLMAEEVFGLNSAANSDYSTRILTSESGSVSEKAAHASISRGDDIGSNSSSILTAAREAARRKVEAASAASLRAENMDAIVKAAELAAEAVSQAGKIVAMGDPFPLGELIEAGPEGYWRTPELVAKSTEMSRELFKAGGGGEGVITSTKHQKGGRSVKKGAQMTVSEQSSIPMDVTTWSESEPVRRVDDISGSVPVSAKETRGQKGPKVSDLTKNIVVVLESEPLSKSSSFNVDNEVEKAVQPPQGTSIKEGSKVEVFKDDGGFKAAWYTAVVLSLNDGKACVSYTEIEQEEGSTQLEEWVALAGEGDNSPRIRIARPVTALQYEGTRKRRRAAIGDYNWTVGDRVDAWMTNSWWEGVVTEKNKRDETSVTVHFPAQNETSTVKAWNLRPSLNWKDGEWVEWSNLQHDFSLQEGDIPLEKRPKLGGSPVVELKVKHKISSTSDAMNSAKPEESRLLELSGIEKTFNVGKGSNREKKPDSTRMARTGLQKEGSRVVFGIPKPGKKRKFMEVSKHYVADKTNKNDEPGDSLKHLKYSVPQGSRASRNDHKEKRVAESKLKGFKPVKQQTAFGRTIPQKNFSSNSVSSSADSGADAAKGKDYSGHNMSLRKQNTDEAGSLSNSEGASDGQFVFSAVASSDARPSRKITPSVRLDRANKGKLAPAARKLGKIEEDKTKQDKTVTSTSEAVEPRRSNRRIQPTSRLLEGLQSSLIIPKFPSFSHDKGQRTQSKHTSRGNNHG